MSCISAATQENAKLRESQNNEISVQWRKPEERSSEKEERKNENWFSWIEILFNVWCGWWIKSSGRYFPA